MSAILTPDQRVRVFVSSTLGELAPERQAVKAAVESLHLATVMFEAGAAAHPPRALYRAYLEQSHVFVGLYWERYGWVAPEETVSGLEDEWRLGVGLPRLVYVKEPAPRRDPRLVGLLAEPPQPTEVARRTFRTSEELGRAVAEDLAALLAARFGRAAATLTAGPTVGEGRAAVPPAPDREPLPVPTTPLLGREQLVRDLEDLLGREDVRLVTLTGPGGIGKTRTALEVARRVAARFPGGAALVRLADLPLPDLVLPAVATAVGVHVEGSRSPLEALADALRDRGPTLVVLDNAEHVVAAGPELASLMAAAPGLRLLVTSRSLLRLSGEHEVVVPPLPAGTPDSAGVRLFVERAGRVSPDFRLTDPADVAAVVEICRRLDGLPLAIELAAARSRVLPPRALLARIDQVLDLPAAPFHDLPARQRTLRDTLDWSVGLLAPAERQALAQLSVFAGSASLAAAEAVLRVDGDVLSALAGLADQSLVTVVASGPDAPRFRLLQTVREYAGGLLEQDGNRDELVGRHRRHYVDLVAASAVGVRQPGQREWLDRLDADLPNLRECADRLLRAGDAEQVAAMAFDLRIWTWLRHRTPEAATWLRAATSHADRLTPLGLSRASSVLSLCLFEQGDYVEADAAAQQAVALAGDGGDPQVQVFGTFMLGLMAFTGGRGQEAVEALARSYELAVTAGDLHARSLTGMVHGMVLARLGRLDEAEQRLADAVEQARLLGNDAMLALALAFAGVTALLRGDAPAAQERLLRAVDRAVADGAAEALGYAVDGLAGLRLAAGDPAGAATLLGAAQALRDRAGVVPWPDLQGPREAIASAARAGLGEAEFEERRQAGAVGDVPAVAALVARTVPATPTSPAAAAGGTGGR